MMPMKDRYHAQIEAYRKSVENYSFFTICMLRDAFDAFSSIDRDLACEIAGGMEVHCIKDTIQEGGPMMHQEILVPRKVYLRLRREQLEEEGLKLIALHQPVASDLRTIACCMNLISSAERIGRYGKDICHSTYKLPEGSISAEWSGSLRWHPGPYRCSKMPCVPSRRKISISSTGSLTATMSSIRCDIASTKMYQDHGR